MNSSEFVNFYVFVNVFVFVNVLFLLLLFLVCSVRPSKYHEPKEIVFIVDNFEPLLCQEHSASDTDSQ